LKKKKLSFRRTRERKEAEMSAKKYEVALTAEERVEVAQVSRSQKHSSRERTRARILLAADSQQTDGAWSDQRICAEVGTTRPTVERVRSRFAIGGVKTALYHKAQAKRKARLVDGAGEAHLIALVCGAPPAGHKQWTLRLLADKYIEAGYIDSISHETVRQVLKKTNSSPGSKKCG
jgi:hypothetical protein